MYRIEGEKTVELNPDQAQFTTQFTERTIDFIRRNNLEAVRHGNWKLVFPHPGRTYAGFEPGNDGMPGRLIENFEHEGGLYDLRRDPGEQYNMMVYYPEMAEHINKIADAAREDLGDDLTGFSGKNRREAGRLTSN